MLQMVEEAVPFPANASGVELGVRLVGTAPSTGVAASLAALLLLPGANASAAVAWGEGLVFELPGVVEPAALSWGAGESGVQSVRLRGVLEALAAMLGESEGWASAPEAHLVVALADAAGADVSETLAGTEVLMDEDTLGGEADAAGDTPGIDPVFGFVPNQVAYPPDDSNSSGSSASSPGIPVRLLSGMLTEPATLLWQLQLLTPATMQFLPSAAMQGVLRFEPPVPGGTLVTERSVPVPLDWSRVPPEAAYRLGLVLHGFHAAHAAGQPDAIALHIFGTPNGTCPPGSALRNPPPAASSAAPATVAAMTPAAGQQGATGDTAQGVADLMLSVNGSVIDLSSAFQPLVRDYGAQVEHDVANVTLCLRKRSAANIAVVALGGSGNGSYCGGSLLQPVDDAELDLDGLCSCEAAYLMYSTADSAADQTAADSSSSCGYSAWQLPLAAGQNRFNITLQDVQVR